MQDDMPTIVMNCPEEFLVPFEEKLTKYIFSGAI